MSTNGATEKYFAPDTYFVSVKHPTKPGIKWERKINKEDYNHILTCCQATRRPLSPFIATLIPVRTHNACDFAKDFFLPTVVNQALKVENVIGKIFAIIGAFVLDLITFPIRLFTFIPRILINPKPHTSPLYKYLYGQATFAGQEVGIKSEPGIGVTERVKIPPLQDALLEMGYVSVTLTKTVREMTEVDHGEDKAPEVSAQDTHFKNKDLVFFYDVPRPYGPRTWQLSRWQNVASEN